MIRALIGFGIRSPLTADTAIIGDQPTPLEMAQ
jgi:hypothetical protein